jgi:hypothetical protein
LHSSALRLVEETEPHEKPENENYENKNKQTEEIVNRKS